MAAFAVIFPTLRIGLDLAEAHEDPGNALVQMPGNLADAIAEWQAAVQIDPFSAIAHSYLAAARSQAPGREAEAIAQCQAALQISPDLGPAQDGLQYSSALRK
jgi:tetratricopeptide (TPR) repeat protein